MEESSFERSHCVARDCRGGDACLDVLHSRSWATVLPGFHPVLERVLTSSIITGERPSRHDSCSFFLVGSRFSRSPQTPPFRCRTPSAEQSRETEAPWEKSTSSLTTSNSRIGERRQASLWNSATYVSSLSTSRHRGSLP
ncbi:hypothetical protein GN956_G11125 [Arapaima gigas]